MYQKEVSECRNVTVQKTALELVNQGQTQIEVAQALGVNPKTLSHWVTTAQARMPEQQRNELEELKRLRLQVRQQQAEIDFLKKSSRVLCQAAQVKYAFLKTCLDSKLIGRRKLISVRKAAALLRISTSGYYQWLKVDRYHRHGVHHSDEELLCHVRTVISRCGKQVPGVMRLYLALRQQGLSVGFKRLRRLLRSNGIFHRYHRKYVVTTDSNHNLARLPNLIDRQFNRYAINQAWCGDITYISTDEGWLFMASVLDLASRCLVGYSFDSTMKTSLVVDALRMAIANEHPAPGLIFHSDQGSQYCSHVFQEFLLRQGISGSMSERGQCWDNAPAESFWATLKRETLPLSGCFSSRKEAQDTVTRWISHYNGTRPHSQLGMRSPYQFRLRAQAL